VPKLGEIKNYKFFNKSAAVGGKAVGGLISRCKGKVLMFKKNMNFKRKGKKNFFVIF
jgi:hypothetical protein